MHAHDSERLAYQAAIREFDALVSHLMAVSDSLAGKTAASVHQSHCEQILLKLLTHCLTLRKISPDPSGKIQRELWDLPSVSAIARCIIETHDAFLYIGEAQTSSEERKFRLALWQLHDQDRRLKMLDGIGSKDPRVKDIEINGAALRDQVMQSPCFQELPPDFQSKIRKQNAPHMIFAPRVMCERFGINYDYYNVATMELSQHVHTFPFSVHQLMEFRAGTEEATRLMKLPIQYSLAFISRVAIEASQIFDTQTPPPPSRTRTVMLKWLSIYSQGIKSVWAERYAGSNSTE